MEKVPSSYPTAMCAANYKLYLFFKKALQVVQFDDLDNPTTHTIETKWKTPSAAVCDNSFAYITAKNGIFKINLDDTLGVTQLNTENWSNTVALGLNGEHLFAVCKTIYRIRVSDGSYSQYNTENWGYISCGASYGDSLYLPTSYGEGHIYKYDMANNMYKSISKGWAKSKAATMYENKLFIIADKTYFVDLESGDYNLGDHDQWKNSKICVATLGANMYAATDAKRLWKLNHDGGYKHIPMDWSEPL